MNATIMLLPATASARGGGRGARVLGTAARFGHSFGIARD
jgi:hypothetical protein